ncbi:hypothetical protein BH23ACT9_BH23ACT9_16970 [soil metagenome]
MASDMGCYQRPGRSGAQPLSACPRAGGRDRGLPRPWRRNDAILERTVRGQMRDRGLCRLSVSKAPIASRGRVAAPSPISGARRHGIDLTIEAGSVASWARVWGNAVHAFTPGLLVAAIDAEKPAPSARARSSGGRGPARRRCPSTACANGVRRSPSPSAPHHCPDCGLTAGRDALSAVLASCVDFADRADPTTATVDYSLTGRRRPPATAGSAPRTGQDPTPTPDETPAPAGDHAGTRPTTNPSAPPDPRSGLRDIT